MLQKLFRIIVRKRAAWNPTPATDGTVPEDVKPPEIEEHSIEVDVSAFIDGYRISANREALSSEGSFTVINEAGQFTPTNNKSIQNRAVIGGMDTFAPLFVEGNEIQVYRIDSVANLGNFATKEGWFPRFRGVIRQIKHGTSEGHDSLEVVAMDVLSLALKKPFIRTYAPVSRSSSLIPSTSFYTTSRMSAAVASMRSLNVSGVMNDAGGDRSSGSIADPSEMPANLLGSTLFWDKEDKYYQRGHFISPEYFSNPSYDSPDELPVMAGSLIPVTVDSATAVFGLNGPAWHVVSGTCTRSTDKFVSEVGSLGLSSALLRADLYKVPTGVASTITIPMKLTSGQSITVSVKKFVWDMQNLSGSTGATLVTQTTTGPFTFDPASLGGTLLNTESSLTSAIEWRNVVINLPNTLFTSEMYKLDTNFIGANPYPQPTTSSTITLLRFEISGSGKIDVPRWEFNSVDVASDLSMVITDNNILGYHSLERWTSEDGIVFTDPNPDHRILMKHNMRVVSRNLAVPYGSGTEKGYAAIHLNHRRVPAEPMYEHDLVEGADFEVLYDKGAIQMAHSFPRSEIFVAHSFVDMRASGHMEASNLIKLMLVHGAGIPAAKIHLEPTGVIMQKVVIDASTNMSIQGAIKDILGQLPGNYYLYADGDANIVGRFIQQSGSPRIYSPILQTPIAPTKSGFTAGQELWYTVTALMPDGKETLPSNLLSTVEYMNYYDAKHASLVDGNTCPALRIKPVPNQVGLVFRRATAHRTAEDTLAGIGTTSPWAAWYLNNGFSGLGHGSSFSNTGGFTFTSLIDLISDVR